MENYQKKKGSPGKLTGARSSGVRFVKYFYMKDFPQVHQPTDLYDLYDHPTIACRKTKLLWCAIDIFIF